MFARNMFGALTSIMRVPTSTIKLITLVTYIIYSVCVQLISCIQYAFSLYHVFSMHSASIICSVCVQLIPCIQYAFSVYHVFSMRSAQFYLSRSNWHKRFTYGKTKYVDTPRKGHSNRSQPHKVSDKV